MKLLNFAFAVILFASMSILPETVIAFGGCDTNCKTCHTLSIKDAQSLLQGFDKKIIVKNIEMSPSQGLWEVTFTIDNQQIIGYIDFAKKNFIHGDIIKLDSKQNLTRDHLIDLNYANAEKVDIKKIPTNDAIIMGNPKAKKRIIVFTDPECPYCARLHQEITTLLKERSDIVFLIKMYPLISIHKDAYRKSKIIVCEKTLDTLEKAFNRKPLSEAPCETNVVDETIRLAEQLGITGTPAIVFPDGRLIKSMLSAYDLNRLIPEDQNTDRSAK
ncbi:MAG: DsbC family protein [Nitrospirae bacterium]|nr:DsbC family protein [Nitrospirota bacterium]